MKLNNVHLNQCETPCDSRSIMNIFFDYKTTLSKDEGNAGEPVGVKVIGAGLPRTGTLSLKTALAQLCSGKCYHMMDVLEGDQEDVDVWVKAAKGEMKPEDWRKYFDRKNYRAGVDFPFSLFYQDIMTAYPDAKVVMSTRDPKTWYSSVYHSIWQVHLLMASHPSIPLFLQLLDRRRPSPHDMHNIIGSIVPKGCDVSFKEAIEGGPAVAEKFFTDWEAEVSRVVPEEKLLVTTAAEGWSPLCKFLGLPIPETDYPRVNDTASIQRMIRNIKIFNNIVIFVIPTTIAVSAYVFREELGLVAQSFLNWLNNTK